LADGDFVDRLPEADLYLLMRVVHDCDDEHARRIMATCRRSAPAGARLPELLPDRMGTVRPQCRWYEDKKGDRS
jgi:hypothetical protein